MGNVLITADSPCDLGESLQSRYQLHYYPYHIILDGKEYTDGVDITPDDLFKVYRERKLLPKTAAHRHRRVHGLPAPLSGAGL